jgi:hypothetical protein
MLKEKSWLDRFTREADTGTTRSGNVVTRLQKLVFEKNPWLGVTFLPLALKFLHWRIFLLQPYERT